MKDLFLVLLYKLTGLGELKEANLYSGGNYANFKIEKDGVNYTVSISKEVVTDEN